MSCITNPPRMTPLDDGFKPAVLWHRAYASRVREVADSRCVTLRLVREDGCQWNHSLKMLPDRPEFREANTFFLERTVKFLLWARGAPLVEIHGAPELVPELAAAYAPGGLRAFDADLLGRRCFLRNLRFTDSPEPLAGHTADGHEQVSHDLDGCRIGFDLGGSDRKCAALIDGEVVFSTEVKWNPYFQEDPAYHLEGIRDSLRLAAAHLPRVDAIGGSAAGIYIDNEPRVASLFRGVSEDNFNRQIRGMFHQLAKEWGDIPFVVANDGDVTALAGAMQLGGSVLGISMGTSLAAGFIDASHRITGWLNELAFAPVDYREDAPVDEWSGDRGCGAQYFSQQAVGRLAPLAGLETDPDMPLPEVLEMVQARMQEGDPRAHSIFRTIGAYFGYSIAHYADFYDFRHVLFLGRVSSGEGGSLIRDVAQDILQEAFPAVADSITISFPDEHLKRHGQAIAAASLPGKLVSRK